jgi:hypothetical protein
MGCCLALPVACVVSVGEDDDDIDDGLGGASGGTSVAGSGGSSAGSNSGGASGSSGSAGSAGSAGMGGSDSIPAPVCTDESGDDECLTCIKQQCCTEWQGCDTVTCQDQTADMIECVVDNMADSEVYNDMCIPLAADPEDFLAANAQAVMTCINARVTEGDAGLETTRCGVACFGVDLFMDD